MLAAKDTWNRTIVSATLAVAFAAAGLLVTTISPGAAPLAMGLLLLASLGATALAFTHLALRVRRLEMENMGLIEEISQEFDRVKERIEIFAEATAEPRALSPEEKAKAEEEAAIRRVVVK